MVYTPYDHAVLTVSATNHRHIERMEHGEVKEVRVRDLSLDDREELPICGLGGGDPIIVLTRGEGRAGIAEGGDGARSLA